MKIRSVRLAQAAMRIWPARPPQPDGDSAHLSQIFRTDLYRSADGETQRRFRFESADFRYRYESDHGFFDQYFDGVDTAWLQGKRVLDIGSLTGGRLVAWAERYGFGPSKGVDIEDVYAVAGNEYAEAKGVDAHFDVSFAERLPFDDDSFDAITSYDVIEHVRDVEAVLRECRRVLRPGGRAYLVFPQFLQPFESHFNLISRTPCLHWFFDGPTLTTAYDQLEAERLPDAAWYARRQPKLESWERLVGLNGISIREFKKMLTRTGFSTTFWGRKPILSDGRRAQRFPFPQLRILFRIPARTPRLDELFLGRIHCVME